MYQAHLMDCDSVTRIEAEIESAMLYLLEIDQNAIGRLEQLMTKVRARRAVERHEHAQTISGVCFPASKDPLR